MCLKQSFEIHDQSTEIRQAASGFQIHEETDVAGSIILPPRHRTKNAHITSASLGGRPENPVQLWTTQFIQSHANPILSRKCPHRNSYTMHMRRTNLLVEASLLKEAKRVLGAKTNSAAVNMALEEIIRIRGIQSLSRFFGKSLWQGDLSEMREDRCCANPAG